jgi:hypothetical protein
MTVFGSDADEGRQLSALREPYLLAFDEGADQHLYRSSRAAMHFGTAAASQNYYSPLCLGGSPWME